MELILNAVKLPGLTVVGNIDLSKFKAPKKAKKFGQKRYFKPFFGGCSIKEVWPKS